MWDLTRFPMPVKYIFTKYITIPFFEHFQKIKKFIIIITLLTDLTLNLTLYPRFFLDMHTYLSYDYSIYYKLYNYKPINQIANCERGELPISLSYAT